MGKAETAFQGAVQGITEFLPVSSTAHLMIFSWLLSFEDGGLGLAVWLHAGTLAAVFICFRKEWAGIARGLLRGSAGGPEAKMGAGLLVTALPAVAGGLVFEQAVSGMLRQPLAVAGGLLFGSAALFVADRKTGNTKNLRRLSVRDCVLLGVAQSFALAPGVSRSGASIAGGMLLGYTREDSAKIALMMGVPAVAAAIAHRVWRDGFSFPNPDELALGAATAALSGIVAIRFLMSVAKRGSYTPFVAYRVAVAGALILWAV